MSSRSKKKKQRERRTLEFGYWGVAFLDLLGQQNAFLRTDRLPDDETKREAFTTEVAASLGVIRQLRRLLAEFQTTFTSREITADSPLHGLTAEQRVKAQQMNATRVRVHRASDGIVLACPLKPGPGHTVPMRAVYDVLATSAALMMIQLAIGRPVRGGIDVGTGVEAEGEEFFGAALVKAYRLESKLAKQPRIVVGDELLNYLRQSTAAPGMERDRQFERSLASGCLKLIGKDVDDVSVLDYAGEAMREVMGEGSSEILKRAHASATSKSPIAIVEHVALCGDYERLSKSALQS